MKEPFLVYFIHTQLHLHCFPLLLPMLVCFLNRTAKIGKLDYIRTTYPVPW